MFGQPTPTVLALGALGAASGIHLWAQWTDVDAVSDPTQPLLMVLLALALWTATSAPRSRLVRLTLLALAFSWLGDSAPRFVDRSEEHTSELQSIMRTLYAGFCLT